MVGLSVTHEEGKKDGAGEDGDGKEEEENEEVLEDNGEKDEENENSGSRQWGKAAHNGEKDEENETCGSHPKLSPRRYTRWESGESGRKECSCPWSSSISSLAS